MPMKKHEKPQKYGKAVNAGIGYVIGNYAIKGLSFFTIPLFTRLLGLKDYGIYSTVFAYEGILFVIIGLAIHSSYKNARYKYRYVEEGAIEGFDYTTYVSATMVILLLNVGAWLLFCNLAFLAFPKLFQMSRCSLNLIILYSFGSSIVTCYSTDIGINYEYKKFILISFLNAIANICLSILFIVTIFRKKRYLGRLLGATVPMILIAIWIICRYFKRAVPRNYKLFLKWGFKYSIPIIPHGLGQAILSQFDRIMIANMAGVKYTGIYGFAYNMYSIIQITAASLDNVWNPWFFEQMDKGDVEVIKQKSILYISLMALFSSAIILISPEMIKLLGTEEYYDAVYCTPPIIAGGFFAYLYTLPACIEYYHEKTKSIGFSTIIAAIINIMLNYVFIKRLGYIAAAYTTLITYVLYFIFHYLVAKKIDNRSLYSIPILLGMSLLVITFMFFTVFLVNNIMIRWFLALAVLVVLFIIEESDIKILKLFIFNKKGGKG